MFNNKNWCHRDIEVLPDIYEKKANEQAEKWGDEKRAEKAKRPPDFDKKWQDEHSDKMKANKEQRKVAEAEEAKRAEKLLSDLNFEE